MPRIMSCAETTAAVLDETKTVTRRLGWWEDRNGRRLIKPGDELSIVKKAMGRKPGEPLVRLALVEVVDVRREPLDTITDEDVNCEGVAEEIWGWRLDQLLVDEPLSPTFAGSFVEWYCHVVGCAPDTTVTRIEWRYLHPTGPIGPPRPPLIPLVEWDDGKLRAAALVPDHLRAALTIKGAAS